MNLKQENKKRISFLLIVSIFSLNFAFLTIPQKVSAYLGVEDTNLIDPLTTGYYVTSQASLTAMDLALGTLATVGNDAEITSAAQNTLSLTWENAGKLALDVVLKIAAMQFLQNITEATVNWINSGYQDQPSFIADPAKFLSDTADQTIGNMIFNNPDLNFLCSPFQLQVKLALGLSAGSYQPFKNKINCTLTSAIANATSSIDSMTSWSDFIKVTQNPANDPIGAFLIAKVELDAQIQTAKDTKTQELAWGQGALSFNECTKTVKDATTGSVITSKVFKGNSANENTIPTPGSNQHITITGCKPKTPGAVVTSMLGFKATSDTRSTELQVALANGLETSINTILSAIVQQAINSLRNGVLDPVSATDRTNFNVAMTLARTQAQNDYNTNSQAIADQNFNISDMLGQGFNAPTNALGTTEIGGTSYDPLYNFRFKDSTRINTLTQQETDYQNNLKTAAALLIAGKTEFANARICDFGYTDSTIYLRGTLIQDKVIANIDGVNYNGTDPLVWNLTSIKSLLAISDANLNILNTAGNAVMSAASLQDLDTAMIAVNSKSGNFNTDSKGILVTSTRNWLFDTQKMYSLSPCTINLNSLLNISTSSVASSTKATTTPITP